MSWGFAFCGNGDSHKGSKQRRGWPDFYFPHVSLEAKWEMDLRETEARGEVRKPRYTLQAEVCKIPMRWKQSRDICGRHSWSRLPSMRGKKSDLG